MSKHKRKAVKHHRPSKKGATTRSLLTRYPRLLTTTGALLVLIAILLLTIGYVSDARVGLSMLALFFGIGMLIFANSTPAKKSKRH